MRRVSRFTYLINSFIFALPAVISAFCLGLVELNPYEWQTILLFIGFALALSVTFYLSTKNVVDRFHDMGMAGKTFLASGSNRWDLLSDSSAV